MRLSNLRKSPNDRKYDHVDQICIYKYNVGWICRKCGHANVCTCTESEKFDYEDSTINLATAATKNAIFMKLLDWSKVNHPSIIYRKAALICSECGTDAWQGVKEDLPDPEEKKRRIAGLPQKVLIAIMIAILVLMPIFVVVFVKSNIDPVGFGFGILIFIILLPVCEYIVREHLSDKLDVALHESIISQDAAISKHFKGMEECCPVMFTLKRSHPEFSEADPRRKLLDIPEIEKDDIMKCLTIVDSSGYDDPNVN